MFSKDDVGMAIAALVIAALVPATACGTSAPPPGPAQAPAPAAAAAPAVPAKPILARFECEHLTLEATFEAERVALVMPGLTITLPQAISASGARYSDGRTTFWNKGNEATLEMEGTTQMCRVLRDPWQEARDRGIEFRAVGQEPGWFLEIDRREMRLLYDYAEREARAPAPAPVTAGGTTTYDAGRLRVVSEEEPCSDAMSGESFPRRVIVTIDGRELRGCGRSLASP